jgi:hypothetical protein
MSMLCAMPTVTAFGQTKTDAAKKERQMTVKTIILNGISQSNKESIIIGDVNGKSVKTDSDVQNWFDGGTYSSLSVPKGQSLSLSSSDGKMNFSLSEGSHALVKAVFNNKTYEIKLEIGMKLKYVLSPKGYAKIVYDAAYCKSAEQTSSGSTKTKSVKIKYVEDIDTEVVIPNAVIYLVYYDSVKSQWVDNHVKSENGEIVTFEVPLKEDGASYTFFHAVTQEEVTERKGKADKGEIRLWRIPADTDYLEFWIDKKGMLTNKVGSMQIWSKE